VRRFDQLYRFQDGKTPLSEAEFNVRFEDVDLRFHKLEEQRGTVESTIEELQRFGLARIDETVGPILNQVQERVADAEAVLEGAQDAVDEFGADAAASLAAQEAALAAFFAAANEDVLWATRNPSALSFGYDPSTGELTGLSGMLGASPFTIALTWVDGEVVEILSGWRGKSGLTAIEYEVDPTFGRRVKDMTHTGTLG
jgi:hypothetical protein